VKILRIKTMFGMLPGDQIGGGGVAGDDHTEEEEESCRGRYNPRSRRRWHHQRETARITGTER
jgi:hypothetical protein